MYTHICIYTRVIVYSVGWLFILLMAFLILILIVTQSCLMIFLGSILGVLFKKSLPPVSWQKCSPKFSPKSFILPLSAIHPALVFVNGLR